MSRLHAFKKKLEMYSTSILDDAVHKIKENAKEYLSWDNDYVDSLRKNGIKACESPIEELFYHALVNTEINLGSWGKVKPIPVYHNKDMRKVKNKLKSIRYIYVFPQAWVGNFRLDFLIKYGVIGLRQEKLLAIECDGRSYHENDNSFTKDRKRDRELNSRNIRVLRFTGREINDSATRCVDDVEKVISSTI